VTSVKKEATYEDEATILSKTVDQLGSNGGVRSVIFSPSVARLGTKVCQVLMTCSGASDDTSIFTQTSGPLNIKDQAGRSAHKEVEPISNISRVIS
jgi:hypothetical protein